MRRTIRATIAALATVPVIAFTMTSPVSAHIEASAMAAGDRTMVRLTMEHGCTEDGATGLRVQLPEGATRVSASDPVGWNSTVTGTEIAWIGGPQPPHDELTFEFMIELAQPAGTTVRLPAIETCADSEIAWIEETPEGGPSPQYPAPSIVVAGTSATTMQMSMGEDVNTAATMAPEETPITEEGSATNNVGLVVLLVVMVIIIGGAVVLFLQNRKPRSRN